MNLLIFFLHCSFIGISLVAASAYRKELLVSLVCIMAILSNLFVVKQINLLGYDVTCTDVFAVGISLGLNLIQEFYGKSLARRTIWISFVCLVFYLCMSLFHLSYIPNQYDSTSQAFKNILYFTPRFVGASLISYFVSQYFELSFFGFLKRFFENKFFLVRNYTSILLAQLIDTVLFSLLGMYNIAGNLFHIIIISYTIKVIVIIFSTPIISLSKLIISNKKIHD